MGLSSAKPRIPPSSITEKSDRERELALATHQQAIDQTMAMTKWLLATLLILNSGALLALLNGDWILQHRLVISCAPFAVGALMSILCGAFLLHNAMYATGEMERLLLKPEIGPLSFQVMNTSMHRRAKVALILGYVSLGLWVLGLLIAGSNLDTASSDTGSPAATQT